MAAACTGDTVPDMDSFDHHDHRPPRVVIAGGGVAALEAAIALAAFAPGAAEVLLISPTDSYHDRPLTIGEPFGLGCPHRYPLADLAASVGARLIVDAVHEVLPD